MADPIARFGKARRDYLVTHLLAEEMGAVEAIERLPAAAAEMLAAGGALSDWCAEVTTDEFVARLPDISEAIAC